MGASREVFFSSLVEPIFLLCLCALARSAESFSFSGIFTYANSYAMIPAMLAGASLFVVMLAENARIPIDDPATHLELTMIHEVMVLDHSGPDFALITYGASLKLWVFGLIVSRTLFPFSFNNMGIDLIITLCCMIIIAIAIGVIESITARLRLLSVPQLLVAAFALALLALLAGEGTRFL
jgi:formate hydrogenlyase subunit 4